MAEQPDTQPLVSEEHLNLALIAPVARKLTLSVKYEGRDSHSDVDFKIRGRLDIDRMIEFLQLETQINDALRDTSDAAGHKLLDALDAGNTAIRDLLLDLNPPADVPPKLHLDEQQVLMTLGWISGDSTVANAIADTITAGVSKALTGEEPAAVEDAADRAGADRADADAPFSSK